MTTAVVASMLTRQTSIEKTLLDAEGLYAHLPVVDGKTGYSLRKHIEAQLKKNKNKTPRKGGNNHNQKEKKVVTVKKNNNKNDGDDDEIEFEVDCDSSFSSSPSVVNGGKKGKLTRKSTIAQTLNDASVLMNSTAHIYINKQHNTRRVSNEMAKSPAQNLRSNK
eukprot:m.67885 g.67885  ORF g.67885 m.67885 type:complete len:164 (-) comp11599_c0_seq1:36-527(-)